MAVPVPQPNPAEETNLITGHPPAVASIVSGVVGSTAGLAAGLNLGPFDAYDVWIILIGGAVGLGLGKIAERWTKRYFPEMMA